MLTCIASAAEPWSLGEALSTPDWLKLSGEQRTRYETQDDQFRAGRTGSDQVLALRTSLQAEVTLPKFRWVTELTDSRTYLSDSGSALDTTSVNALEVLQTYLEFDLGPLGQGQHHLRIGRETLDLGNRRLLARNAYRNTINAFTGLDWRWETDSGAFVRALWFLPNQRQPDDNTSLLDNDIAFDDQDFDLQLWALYASTPLPWDRATLELYFFGLHEQGADTRHRQLYTPGLRLFRLPKKRSFDFEWESVYQFGNSRSTLNGADLDHRAHFHHLGLGYSFDLPWSPNLRLSYDYASGDRRPGDGHNQRFDTLYGARRFEYGPTGSYGLIARSNLSSPEIRLSLKPASKVEFMIAHRGIWLAAAHDSWTSAGVRDASGQSGRFVGQQLEARLRWDVLPGNLRLEIGLAQLFPGSYLERAPNGNPADTTYGYSEITWRF